MLSTVMHQKTDKHIYFECYIIYPFNVTKIKINYVINARINVNSHLKLLQNLINLYIFLPEIQNFNIKNKQ